jgi:hypothetical protein
LEGGTLVEEQAAGNVRENDALPGACDNTRSIHNTAFL